MQRKMEKRYLNVYLLKDADKLMLRFVEVQRKEEEPETDEPENWRRLREARKPRFDRVWSEFHNKLNFEYVEYCTGH